jgi:RNA polymerase sigma-70 factor (ECF subfamily)
VGGSTDLEGVERSVAGRLDVGDLAGAASSAVRGFGPHVLNYLRALLHDEESAYDVFAEVCERLWRDLPRFRREVSFRTWIYKLAWCAAQDHRRSAARHPTEHLATSRVSQLAAEVRSMTPGYLQSGIHDRWAAIRTGLDEEDRSLLLLRVDQGLSWKDIAAVMSPDEPVGEAALRKRFERLKERLREELRAQGLLEK